jgi:hypothetical protein
VRAATTDEAAATGILLAFMREYVAERASPMCGNSICQDRRFMARWLPGLEAYFHYRNLDVSTLKELARRWKPEVYKGVVKKGAHTALADIHESIEELRYYRDNFIRLIRLSAMARIAASRPAVEESNSPLPESIFGRISRAICLPCSTPHWSKLFTPHRQPCTATLCS